MIVTLRLTKIKLKAIFAVILLGGVFTFQAANAQELNPAICLAPLPFFEDYTNGFVILRDGTRLDGEINLKDYEKTGEKIQLKTKDGNKYKFSVYSMKYFGLNINVPRNLSPLNLYDWKTEKRKETKGPERGFVVLQTGETLDGKIRIEGRSSDSPWAAGNYFAIETLEFTDAAGKMTLYTREKIKSFGRILPWELAPSEMWEWQKSVAFGVRKSKFQSGFLIMTNGTRVEGEMQLVVKNKMSKSTGGDMMERKEVKPKTYSEVVDEIYFKRDGKDEKISLDDVLAYGIANMTINTLTNKGTRIYQKEEMNFHDGSVTTRDGKTMSGFIAYRPYASNYYGVYYAAKPDDPITIVPRDDIKEVVQNISLVEAFDDGSGPASAPKLNTNINGYIISLDGKQYEGTIKLVGEMDWYVKSIEFTDKEGNFIKYGDTNEAISSFVINDNIYVQSENVFVKAEFKAEPFTMYQNPYPPKGNFGTMVMTSVVSTAIGIAAAEAMESAQMSGLDLTGVSVDGVDLGSGNAPEFVTVTVNGQQVKHSQAYNVVGPAVTDLATKAMTSLIEGKHEVPEKGKKPSYHIYNIKSQENGYLNISQLLEGCMTFHSLEKDKVKELEKDDRKAIEFINTCYSKDKK